MVDIITQALRQYEQRLRDLGAAVVDQLRPGLTAEQIDAVEAEFGVRLTDEARAVWAWHDGVEPLRERGPFPTLAPYRVFPSLRSALIKGRQIAEAYNPTLDDPETEHLRWNPNWVILTTDGKLSVIIDCSHRIPDGSRTALFVPGEWIDSYIQLPLVHRIGWWNWALEHGAWVITPDGGWQLDEARYPAGPGLSNVLF